MLCLAPVSQSKCNCPESSRTKKLKWKGSILSSGRELWIVVLEKGLGQSLSFLLKLLRVPTRDSHVSSDSSPSLTVPSLSCAVLWVYTHSGKLHQLS